MWMGTWRAGLPGSIMTIQSGEQDVREDGCTLPQSSFHDSQTLMPIPPPSLDLPARAYFEDEKKMHLSLGPCSTCSTWAYLALGPTVGLEDMPPLSEDPIKMERLQVQEAFTAVQ